MLKSWKLCIDESSIWQLEASSKDLPELAELYEQFQGGECSFGYMSEQLGVTTWDLYDLLERRGLRTTNL